MRAGDLTYAVLEAPAQPPPGLFEVLGRALDEPPYTNVPAMMRKRTDAWPDFARVPGFRVATARAGERLVGVGFGWRQQLATANQPPMFGGLYQRLRDLPFAEALDGFEVVELGVDPDARGAGVGEAIVRRLVGDGPAWLLADEGAPAYGWYLRRGWRPLGRVREDSPYVAMTFGRAGAVRSVNPG